MGIARNHGGPSIDRQLLGASDRRIARRGSAGLYVAWNSRAGF